MTRIIVWAVLFTSLTIPALASETKKESIFAQEYLTGNWNGLRDNLEERGISFDLEYTSTYQGLLSGKKAKKLDYGGRFDAFLDLDSSKLGLWEDGGFHMHAEYNHGKPPVGMWDPDMNNVFFPVNTAQVLPQDRPEHLEFTSLYFSQKIGENINILLGKINSLDLLADDLFFGGWGIHRFMHLAFTAPPSGVFPATIFGAIISYETDPVVWTFSIFDPEDRTADYLPGDLFRTGINLGISAAISGKIMGRKTKASIDILYSTKRGIDLSDVLLPPELEAGTKKGSYNISFKISHNIQESADNPDDAWGIFLKMALADGNPNTIKASFISGIGGKALFFGRPQDSFGLGYFYYAFSDELRSALRPAVNVDNEQGAEMFYSYEVTPWLHVTADIQYIDPASGDNNNALIGGLRVNIKF